MQLTRFRHTLLSGLTQDLVSAVRQIRRQPAVTAVLVVALSLGIGASTAIFSVVWGVLLRPLPFRDADRVVTLWESDRKRGQREVEVSWHSIREWRKQPAIFAEVGGVSSVNLDFALTGKGEPRQVEGTILSASVFRALGVQAHIGRIFTPEEDRPGGPLVAVISYRLWQSYFGGNPAIVGQKTTIDSTPTTIVGVMPPDFDFPRGVDVWAPLLVAAPIVEQQPGFRILRAVGKLAPGLSVTDAQTRLDVVAERLAAAHPKDMAGFGVLVHSLTGALFGKARQALWLLLAAVLLVLLIACANAGNLLLARASARRQEMAVRAAVGAGRARLIRQLLAESALLAFIGCAGGLLAADWGVEALRGLAPADLFRFDSVRLDAVGLTFAAGLSALTVLLFGLAPALEGSRLDVHTALKETGLRTAATPASRRWRDGLVAGGVAVSAVLLIGALLLIRSFDRFRQLDPGFRAENVLTFRVTLNQERFNQQQRRAFFADVLAKLRALPGVESAGAVLIRPLSGTVGWDYSYTIEGQLPDRQASNPNSNYEAISPGYFATMAIPIVDGRDFHEGDRDAAPPVAIVSEAMARRFFPGRSAVGQRLKIGPPASKQPWLTIVGVARDVRYREWEATRFDLYTPVAQRAQHRSDFVVKCRVDPHSLVPAIRKAVLELDPEQPVSSVTTMDRLVRDALAQSKFQTTLLALFAFCALALAVVGVYGVISYAVSRRTREIGIRMALGSTPQSIRSLVVREGMKVAGAGLLVGLIAAAALARMLEALLFGVQPLDPTAFAIAALAVLTVSALACLAPARRAARVDPLTALQYE